MLTNENIEIDTDCVLNVLNFNTELAQIQKYIYSCTMKAGNIFQIEYQFDNSSQNKEISLDFSLIQKKTLNTSENTVLFIKHDHTYHFLENFKLHFFGWRYRNKTFIQLISYFGVMILFTFIFQFMNK